MLRIFSVIYWTLAIIIGVAFYFISAAIWLLTVWWDKRRRILHMWASVWAATYTIINPLWRIRVHERHKVNSNEAKVIISNHQSATDIFFMYLLFTHFKWVSKIEMFKTPFIGWNMTLNKYIPLKRGSMKANSAMMKECAENLEAGNSVFIFPEGTRSESGKLIPFKTGAFELALRSKVAIQPVYINGSNKALKKKTLIVRPTAIDITVMDIIRYDSFADLDAKQLRDKVKEIFLAKQAEVQGG